MKARRAKGAIVRPVRTGGKLTPAEPYEHSSQMCTIVVGRTYESQMGHLPSQRAQSLPIVTPGCLRHMIMSGSARKQQLEQEMQRR